jgi:metacaspase-1
MKKGISLHLGLNYVDPIHYDGWDGELFACEADAQDMKTLAKSQGFKPQVLLRKQVTAKAVKTAILKAAKTLKRGDIFFLSYSGHGGQVDDVNGDEGRFGDTRDGKDETWCLYDRELVDDELAALYAQFKAGVRILVLSDSCHSGTVTRKIENMPKGRARLMPPATARAVNDKHRALYEAIQRGVKGSEEQEIKATVILISGCQDRQLSRDGDFNGAFTGALKDVWDNAAFQGNYRNFRDTIVEQMARDQTPNYFVIGSENKEFEDEIPFTIDSKAAKAAAATKAKGAAAKRQAPIDFVLKQLVGMGLTDAKATTSIRKFFAQVEKADQQLGLEVSRTALFAEKLRKAYPRAKLTVSDLLKGKYLTPQAIADLAK